jgi:uncharacterized membrane protein
MKQFIKTIFRITPFQVLIIVLFSSLKYILNRYNLTEVIQKPMIWILLVLGFIFISSLGIYGIIENKQKLSESEQTRVKYLRIEKRYSGIINLGIWIPALIATGVFVYMIAPTTLQMLIALLAGIFIRNLFDYFKSKSVPLNEEQN